MHPSDVQPRIPRGKGWRETPHSAAAFLAPGCRRWFKKLDSDRVLVLISSVDPVSPDMPEWHISVSMAYDDEPQRPSDDECAIALLATEMVVAVEDNDGSRNPYVRHFWRPTR